LPTLRHEATAVDSAGQQSANRKRIVLVDDDDAYREAATTELDYLGFDVIPLANGAALLDFFAAGQSCDVIVLDWYLEAGSSIDLPSQLRSRGVEVPVVFLTGVPATAYECAALDGGALDFVDKVRGLEILARRLRRPRKPSSAAS
jgi:two-component system, OmpR family, response regulator ChvI